MPVPLLTDLLVAFGLSVLILLLCHKLKVPGVVGLLLTGVIAGPHVLGLVRETEEVEVLAEVGVVLLLFTIGIEFSLTRLFQIRRAVMLGGALQVVLTTGAIYLVATSFGAAPGTALFAGFLASLSSTAIVLKVLHERAEVESPHGRTVLAVLIFQDMAVVPMMLLAPLLGGGAESPLSTLLLMLAKGAAVLALVYVCARFVVPRLLYQIAETRSRELFVLSAIVICFAVAWLTSFAGLSLGLGAFLAGLIISESEYSHQALGGILPFRDVFTSFFFVSIGMLLDFGFIIRHPWLIVVAVAASLLLKGIVGGMVAFVLRLPLRTMVIVGVALSQIGEFSFVLAKVGIQYRLLDHELYQGFLAVAVLTMAATPFLLSAAPGLADLMQRIPIPTRWQARLRGLDISAVPSEKGKLRDHLIVVGFGISGRLTARAARRERLPYIVIDTNPDTVKEERRRGEPLLYGDASYDAVLEHAGVGDALVMVVATNDPIATRRIVQVARGLNPDLRIIVRTSFMSEIRPLMRLGASEVVPEEFEASVEILSRVLARFDVPSDRIGTFVELVRSEEGRNV